MLNRLLFRIIIKFVVNLKQSLKLFRSTWVWPANARVCAC